MANIYYDADANLERIQQKRIAVIGYGSQGHARALDVIMILIPDQHHREVFERDIKPGLAPGKMLMTAHGFSLHYSQIVPPADVDVAMVAPKSPGHMLRRLFTEGVGV